MPKRRTSNLQFYVGGHLLEALSLKDVLGADDDGLDRGGGEVGPRACKFVVDKH